MIDLKGAKVLITGAGGFLGRYLLKAVDATGADVIGVAHKVTDLRIRSSTRSCFERWRPDYVFHVAGYNGGIAFNAKYPADIFRDNTLMALNVLEACREYQIKKLVSVVASCAYPEDEMHWYDTTVTGDAYVVRPREKCVEDEFLDGPTHPSVACHGYAKRNLQLGSHFYKQQYGLNAVCACPTTLYGPGDSFDRERTKVMGGMVARFVDAVEQGSSQVECWGSGEPLREFLYVEDAAKLLVETLLNYDDPSMPLNLGSGQELTMADLAAKVAEAAGYNGTILWNRDRPDGQFRKRLDLMRMAQILPPVELTPLEEGIRRTVEYYRSIPRHVRVAS